MFLVKIIKEWVYKGRKTRSKVWLTYILKFKVYIEEEKAKNEKTGTSKIEEKANENGTLRFSRRGWSIMSNSSNKSSVIRTDNWHCIYFHLGDW